MTNSLSYEKILELFNETDKRINMRLKKEAEEREKSRKDFEEKLEKDFEKRMKDYDRSRKEYEEYRKENERSRKEFNREFEKKLGEITGTLGRFVEGMVEPKLLELFQDRGIKVTEIYHNIEIHKKGMEETEIDLLLVNSDYSIAVEVKTTLKVRDVDDHLERLKKLTLNPIRLVKGTILIGAIAGMRIEEYADKYAYRKGLYVLKQKGEIVEIANDEKFRPREWVVK